MTRRILALLLLAGCAGAAEFVAPLGPPGVAANAFPAPARPVASIISDIWATEDFRERTGEAATVMRLLGIGPGMAVADIGAGSGYYTLRVARVVGPTGRVLAQDVTPRYLEGLRRRVARERPGNVEVGLGEPHDPRLPARSTDVALMIHMYHEIDQPYALLHNLLPALRDNARVAILDSDRRIEQHGTPPALLDCELAAVGYRRVAFHWLPERTEYLAVFAPPAQPPAPASIRACPLP